MSSNDGQRLLVFGLGFREHHTLRMQQVLRNYNRLPENRTNRAALFTSLFNLSNDLSDEEAFRIQDWLRDGGAFPQPTQPHVTGAEEETGIIADDVSDEEEDWPVYNQLDYESDPGEEDVRSNYDESMSDEVTGNVEEEEEAMDEDAEMSDNVSDGHTPHSLVSSPEHTRTNQSPCLRAIDEKPYLEDNDDGSEASEDPSSDGESDHSDRLSEEKIECAICCDVHDADDIPDSMTPTCGHVNQEKVCISCVRYYVQRRLEKGLIILQCPFCTQPLGPEQVKAYCTPEIIARYEYLVEISNPDITMCLHPDCSKGQLHKDEDPMMICKFCSFKTCTFHKLPWHEGKTCEQFDMEDSQIERLEQAEATVKLLTKERAQVCPNCHQGVSRTDGCRCGNEWCYICGVSFDIIKSQGETAHAQTCIYHPRRTSQGRPRNEEHAKAGQLSELVLGGLISETLARARQARNERIQAEMRPRLAEAAEKRAKEAEKKRKEAELESGVAEHEKRKRVNLHAPWEER